MVKNCKPVGLLKKDRKFFYMFFSIAPEHFGKVATTVLYKISALSQ